MKRSYGISLGSRISVLTVLVVLVLLDVLSVVSRVGETVDTCQQILDGYQIEQTYSDTYRKVPIPTLLQLVKFNYHRGIAGL